MTADIPPGSPGSARTSPMGRALLQRCTLSLRQ